MEIGMRKRVRCCTPDDAAVPELADRMKRCCHGGTMQLPDDVIAEILARLTVKSVMRFKSVCKDWLAMTSHQSFIHLHLECSKKNPSAIILPVSPFYFCQRMETMQMKMYRYRPEGVAELFFERSLADAQEGLPRPVHCAGLVAVCTRSLTYVCNPATREAMELPGCRQSTVILEDHAPRVGLCRDTRSNAYKLFHPFYRWHDISARTCSMGVEVLTLGGESPCWRELPEDPPFPIMMSSPPSVDGALYWLIQDELHALAPKAILCLDASTEEYTLVPGPPFDWNNRQNTLANVLREIEGKLCFLHVRKTYGYELGTKVSGRRPPRTEIWFMSGSRASPVWTRYCAIDFPWRSAPISFWREHEMLLSKDNLLLSYNHRNNMLGLVGCMLSMSCFHDLKTDAEQNSSWQPFPTFHISAYAESLVTIKNAIVMP